MAALSEGSKNLIQNANHIAYFMRGAVQYKDVLDETFFERNEQIEFINERLKNESKKAKDSKGHLPPIY